MLLSASSLEQHVVRQDHGGRAVLIEDRHDVLNEVELLVRGRHRKIGALVVLASVSTSPSSREDLELCLRPNGGLVST